MFSSILPKLELRLSAGAITGRLAESDEEVVCSDGWLEAFQGAEVADLAAAQRFFTSLFTSLLGGFAIRRPRVTITLPGSLSSVQEQAYVQALVAAGAMSVDIAFSRDQQIAQFIDANHDDFCFLYVGMYDAGMGHVVDRRLSQYTSLPFSAEDTSDMLLKRLRKESGVRIDPENRVQCMSALEDSGGGGVVQLRRLDEEVMQLKPSVLVRDVDRLYSSRLELEMKQAASRLSLDASESIARKGCVVVGVESLKKSALNASEGQFFCALIE